MCLISSHLHITRELIIILIISLVEFNYMGNKFMINGKTYASVLIYNKASLKIRSITNYCVI